MATKNEIGKALIAANDGAILATVAQICRLTGFGRTYITEVVNGLRTVGGKKTYFLPEVADRLYERGM